MLERIVSNTKRIIRNKIVPAIALCSLVLIGSGCSSGRYEKEVLKMDATEQNYEPEKEKSEESAQIAETPASEKQYSDQTSNGPIENAESQEQNAVTETQESQGSGIERKVAAGSAAEQKENLGYINFPLSMVEKTANGIRVINGDKNPTLILSLDCNFDEIGDTLNASDNNADMCITQEKKWKDYVSNQRDGKVKEIVYIFTDRNFKEKNPSFKTKETWMYNSSSLQYNKCLIDWQEVYGIYVSAIEITRNVSGNSSTVEKIREADEEYAKPGESGD